MRLGLMGSASQCGSAKKGAQSCDGIAVFAGPMLEEGGGWGSSPVGDDAVGRNVDYAALTKVVGARSRLSSNQADVGRLGNVDDNATSPLARSPAACSPLSHQRLAGRAHYMPKPRCCKCARLASAITRSSWCFDSGSSCCYCTLSCADQFPDHLVAVYTPVALGRMRMVADYCIRAI